MGIGTAKAFEQAAAFQPFDGSVNKNAVGCQYVDFTRTGGIISPGCLNNGFSRTDHIVIYNHPASGYVGIQGNNLRLLAGKTLFHNLSAVQPQTAAHFLHPFRPPHVGRSQNRVFTDISNHLSYQRFGGQMNRTDGTFKVILGAE